MTLEKAKKIIKSECYIADLLNLDRTRMVNTALDTVIKAAEETRWIPVSERLPDTNDKVLCWYEYYHWSQEKVLPEYGIGCYLRSISSWFGEVANGKDVKVIAWMPLQPYRAEEEKPILANNVCKKTTCPYYKNPDYERCIKCEQKAKKAIDIMNDVINAENIPYEGTDDR